MSWFADHWFAAALFAGYTAILVANADAGRRHSATLEEFLVGGRRMGGAMIGISFYATFASTNSYVGHAGKGYTFGLPWMIMAALLVVFAYLSWTFVAPRLRRVCAASPPTSMT